MPAELNGSVFEDLVGGSSEEEVVVEPGSTAEVTVGESLISENGDQNDVVDNNDDHGDFITSFLGDYGVQNGTVKFENEDGSVEEVSFNDLDDSEKLNILRELASPGLSKDEIETINYLRRNNATIRDVVDYYSEKAVQDYIDKNGPVNKQYKVDDYDDDEIYIADLKSKFPDMTDEELKDELDTIKANEDLYNKKVTALRNQYKAREEEEEKELVRQQEQQYEDFRSSIEESLNKFNEISMDYRDNDSKSLSVEMNEKAEIYDYILKQDENGATQFFKDLNDPEKIVKLAWFLKYGDEAISNITNYWKSQLSKSRRSENQPQTTVVRKDNNNKKDTFIKHRHTVETNYGENLL